MSTLTVAKNGTVGCVLSKPVKTRLSGTASFVDYIVQAIVRIYDIITSSGVQILIFLAALQSVPGSMYEVAKMEGATAYEVEANKSALYNVWVGYRAPNGNKVTGLALNGSPHGDLALASTDVFTELKAGKMLLHGCFPVKQGSITCHGLKRQPAKNRRWSALI